jgi:hypothetical protein
LALFFSSISSGSGASAKSHGEITDPHNIQNALAGANISSSTHFLDFKLFLVSVTVSTRKGILDVMGIGDLSVALCRSSRA